MAFPKAQHALAFVVLTGWALLLWPAYAWRLVPGMLAYGAGIELAPWWTCPLGLGTRCWP